MVLIWGITTTDIILPGTNKRWCAAMYSTAEIRSKAWLVKEVCNLVLGPEFSVDRIFLVGSYAQNRATDYSDIDYLVQLKGGKRPLSLPTWTQVQEVNRKIDNKRIHVIFGWFDVQ